MICEVLELTLNADAYVPFPLICTRVVVYMAVEKMIDFEELVLANEGWASGSNLYHKFQLLIPAPFVRAEQIWNYGQVYERQISADVGREHDDDDDVTGTAYVC